MNTVELLNNPAIVIGGLVGVKIFNQALGEFLDNISPAKRRYITKEECAICKLQSDHKFNSLLREITDLHQEVRGLRQLLITTMERTNTPIRSQDIEQVFSHNKSPV